MPHFTRALRHRNYRLFFSGQLISLVGTWMQGIAESWLVYRLTGSAALLGVAGFASQIPVLFLATIGGSVADRYNRHRILVVTQTASMILPLTLAALVFTGRVQVWHVFALAAGLGIVNAFDVPARQSFVVEMVGKEDLVNAIALNSSIVNAARAIGPAVAGILMAAVGEGWCFLINGVSYIAVITGLLMMKLPPRLQTDRPPAAFAHVTHGFRYVRATMPVRDLLLMVGLVSFAGMPYSTLMPIFAQDILHGGARGLGLLMASAGVGSLCGALALASRSTVRGLGRVVGASALVFGLALIAVRDVPRLLAVGRAAVRRRDVDDHAGRVDQHADPVHGARLGPRPRDGDLRDELHGHGADWRAGRRLDRRTHRRALHGDDRRLRVRGRRDCVQHPAAWPARARPSAHRRAARGHCW